MYDVTNTNPNVAPKQIEEKGNNVLQDQASLDTFSSHKKNIHEDISTTMLSSDSATLKDAVITENATIESKPLNPTIDNLGDEEALDLEPWKKYEKNNLTLSTEDQTELSTKISYPPLLIQKAKDMNSKDLYMASIFLNTDSQSANSKVQVKDLKTFVIKTLKGYIIPAKKGDHYMVPSFIEEGKWINIVMHRLHGDDADNLPRNTPYWNKVKELFENVGIKELLDYFDNN